MHTPWLSWNESLSQASRLQPAPWSRTGTAVRMVESLLLMTCGMAAACTVLLLEFKWRLPGHAILRTVFPMALGFALVPRRGSGTLMGLSALAASTVIIGAGWGEKGFGSLTSLLLIGPLLDAALRWSSNGKRIYFALISAGMLANLLAMGMQVAAKSAGWSGGGGKSLSAWLPLACVTYPAFGLLAGSISAAAFFRWQSSSPTTLADRA